MFRDNMAKLERHEYRERELGEQLKNVLATIETRQKEADSADKTLDTVMSGLMPSIELLKKAAVEDVANQANSKVIFDSIDEHVVSGASELKTILEMEQKTSGDIYKAFDNKLTVLSSQISALQARFDSVEQAPKPGVTNEVLYELLKKIADSNSVGGSESSNITSQLMQQTKHELMDAIESVSTRLDEAERKRDAAAITLTQSAEFSKAFQDDVQNSFRLMSGEVKVLSDVERVLVQTADNVLDTKRRIEYSTHQILLELTDVVNTRTKEINETINTSVERAVKTVLDAQAVGMANLSLKIETEISQVWRQIGIMYQTLTASADTLATLQKQTDTFVNSTLESVDGVNNKVSAIAGRMSEVDENLNYLLGRLSLVTQEFKEIKIGLGEALESMRIGLQTVQGNNTMPAVDQGPGPNPIDEEPLTDANTILSKTVYTVT
ncbi:uncharacterized protein LOC126838694 isoform X2 [Adelges cooleyi]|nr:uncharacterized protein LOC126838694 isoform X2 [Adelges cooleyi]